MKRMKVENVPATYHAMSRVVGGAKLLGDREKEVFRKTMWRVADFCGVEILTYCVMSNHFHVLVRVPDAAEQAARVSNAELLRRFKVLYPQPTKYQTVEHAELEAALMEGGDTSAGSGQEGAEAVRRRLLARMHDLSEFMKTLKQRFSIWYNRNHGERRGTLWTERFKSVLVEGKGNPLQTMAAYIDLNPVRAGLVEDPKDYRFCGYAEAVSGGRKARRGLRGVWADHVGSAGEGKAMEAHRMLIFAKGASPWTRNGKRMDERKALKVLNEEKGQLPRATVLRCRVRYFTDGAILGSENFVRGLAGHWQARRGRKYPPKIRRIGGADWGDLAVVSPLRRRVFE